MANTNFPTPQGRQKKQDPMEMIRHYWDLIWLKKYWVLGITIAVTIIWMIIYSLFLRKPSEYTSTAVMKFDDPRSRTVGAFADFAPIGSEGNVAILKANTFLFSVIDSLKLSLIVKEPGINRFELFRNIAIKPDAKYGEYKLRREDNHLDFVYSNRSAGIKNRKIQSIAIPKDSVIHLNGNGLEITLNYALISKYNEFLLGLNPKHVVADYLNSKIETTLDRATRTLLTIKFTSTNAMEAAQILNTLVNMFTDKLLEVKKYKTTSVLKSLEEQLLVARTELDKSEQNLLAFREQNPGLMLSNTGVNIVGNLSSQQANLQDVESRLTNLSTLLAQRLAQNNETKNLAYLEIINFLEAQQVTGSQVLSTQYGENLSQRTALINQNYSPDHPLVQKLDANLQELQNEVDKRINNLQAQLLTSKQKIQSNVYSKRRELRNLPNDELKLAELQRDRDVKGQIYSNILVRYNEAKVSDAAVISDALIIDEAQVPIVYSNGVSRLLFIGPFLGLIIAVFIFIGLDYLDASVKNVQELESKLKLPVLASLPVIIDDREVPDEVVGKNELEPKLITSDYAPSVASEKFRIIRTKLLIEHEIPKKALIVASLTPGDGKSLISSNLAITFAQQKVPTVLIDCDLRRGVLHNSFNCRKKPGLADLLIGGSAINKAAMQKLIQQTHVPHLSLIPNGIAVPNPSEILGSDRMKKFLDIAQSEFGMVILDTPPIEIIADAIVLNSFVHNILFVVRYGKTSLSKLSEKISEYTNIKDDFRGIVLNASTERDEKDYYQYSYYHY